MFILKLDDPIECFFSFTLAKQKCVDLMFAYYQMHKLAEAKQVLYVCVKKTKQQHKYKFYLYI